MSEDVNNEFSERLALYMKKRGFKNTYVREMSGMSEWTLKKWKNGDIVPLPWEQYGFIAFLDTVGLPEE